MSETVHCWVVKSQIEGWPPVGFASEYPYDLDADPNTEVLIASWEVADA